MEIPSGVVQVPIQIRFADTDQAGHVNNATTVTFLESARLAWIKERAPTYMSGFPIIIAKVEINYLAPINLYDEPIVSIWISRIGSKSFDMDYIIHQEKDGITKIYSTARTVVVYYDYSKLETVVIPEEIRVIFKGDLRDPL
ncbi:MAG: acyl-CoA thioesterase [Candidatus Kariarchaeaceae archaeon]|jgi:acyl-CoA thioester hydrolase